MKLFWIIIALFTLASAGYLLTDSSGSPAAPSPTNIPAPQPVAIPAPAPVTPAAQAQPAAPQTSVPTNTPPSPEATATPAPTQVAKAAEPNANSEEQGYVEPRKPDAEGAPEVEVEEPPTRSPANAAETFAIAPGKFVKQDDGSMLVDDRFTLKGDGSAQTPFEVPWELITSAEETYEPRSGKLKIPERVAILNGKHVKINGYVAFPMYVQQPRELLAMLNQWDGCCIGVPPTPYDAIEVQLKQVVDERARLATAGAVQGIFRVKPYVVGDWLVGLYVMEEGQLTPEEFGGFGS